MFARVATKVQSAWSHRGSTQASGQKNDCVKLPQVMTRGSLCMMLGLCCLPGLRSYKCDIGNNRLGLCYLSFKSCCQRLEIAKCFEGNIVPFDLRPQTAEKIVDPERKVRCITKQHFHPCCWRRQSGVLKSSMQSNAHFRICSRALDDLAGKSNPGRP